MPHPLLAALSLAALQPAAPAPAPAPVVPAPAAPAADPAPPTPPAQPDSPAPAAAQPPAQPAPAAPPAQPYAQPTAPAQPYPPAQPPANQPYPPAQQPYPPAQPYANQPYPPAQQPYGQPGYPPNPYYGYPPPPPANNMAEGTGNVPESVSHRKVVFANLYTLNFNVISPIPSGDFTFFLGTNLRPRKNRARTFDWNTALGYQLTLSVGLADMPTFDFGASGSFLGGFFVHRHHLTAMGYGGSRQRLFYSFGGGAIFDLSELAGIEGEGRLGYVFTPPERRVKGVVGGQARLTSAFSIPLLQVGPFVGFMAF